MHMLVHAVLHFTVLAIVGYLLLYTASKADGLVALIGRMLGLWVFVLAILSVLAAFAMPMTGGKPYEMEMMRGHGMGWMHRWDHDGPPEQSVTPAPAPAMEPAPVAPPAPVPAKKKPG